MFNLLQSYHVIFPFASSIQNTDKLGVVLTIRFIKAYSLKSYFSYGFAVKEKIVGGVISPQNGFVFFSL